MKRFNEFSEFLHEIVDKVIKPEFEKNIITINEYEFLKKFADAIGMVCMMHNLDITSKEADYCREVCSILGMKLFRDKEKENKENNKSEE